MDSRRFDQLTTALARAGTRRGLLGLLTTLPVLGGLVASLHDPEETEAKGRRRHGKGKGKGKHTRKGKGKSKNPRQGKPNHRRAAQRPRSGGAAKPAKCTPTKSCAQWCASVFGADTPAAKACTSDATSCQGACYQCGPGCGTSCSQALCGQRCVTLGTDQHCSGCDDACPAGAACRNGQCGCVPECTGKVCGPDGCGGQCGPGCAACESCQGDGTCSDPCGGSGCCSGTTCESGMSDTACGRNGDACQVCSGTGVTCGGGGTAGVCGCTPLTTCPGGKNCGTIDDGCGGTVSCGGPCGNPTPVCSDNVCAACTQSDQCPAGQMCDGGSCVACDVCASGCTYTTVQAAINAASAGATIRICPGTYGGIAIVNRLTLIGAGDGTDAANNTIIKETAGRSAVFINGSSDTPISLAGLRLTGGTGFRGVINFSAPLTMTGCTVTGNTTTSTGGGILNDSGGTVTMTGCTITGNTAGFGGGIYNRASGSSISSITLDATSVTGNTATAVDGGGGIYNGGGTVTLQNGSTVTGNSEPNCVGFSDPACGP